MVVRKILETTIPSGGTTATFTDSDIPNSLIRVYSTNSSMYPQNISLSGNVLTVTYEAVSSNTGVALEIVKQGLDIDDTLTSDASDQALSAKQGKVLKDALDDLATVVSNLDIPDNITDLDDVSVTSIQDGQVLAWDDIAEKFVNVDPGNNEGIIYTDTETVIGLWFNKPLYMITVELNSPITLNYNTWTDSGIDIPNGICIDCKCILYQVDGNTIIVDANIDSDGNLYLLNLRNNPMSVNTIIVTYTKTTD